MEDNANRTVHALYRRWCVEDRNLEQHMDELQEWASQVDMIGTPRFSELSQRLRLLQHRLVAHFEREGEIGSELMKTFEYPPAELEANQRQMLHDHQYLLAQLGQFLRQLEQDEPPFESWQQAMDELGRFFDAFEQHEEQEGDAMEILMPPLQEP